jgi:hypothetical protein
MLDIEPGTFMKDVLVSSIYAETLRLYVKTYFMVSSPHKDVHLGKWLLPKSCIGLMNAGISQFDKSFWNERGGEHPVNSFWADRFIIDPTDPYSGPVAPLAREYPVTEASRASHRQTPEGRSFTMEGTEGSWFPFGGECYPNRGE